MSSSGLTSTSSRVLRGCPAEARLPSSPNSRASARGKYSCQRRTPDGIQFVTAVTSSMYVPRRWPHLLQHVHVLQRCARANWGPASLGPKFPVASSQAAYCWGGASQLS